MTDSFPTPKHPAGTRARDTVSGWEGTLTAAFCYMNGCVRYEIAGVDKDGKPESYVFDEQQIAVIVPVDDKPPVPAMTPAGATRGGPRDNRPPER